MIIDAGTEAAKTKNIERRTIYMMRNMPGVTLGYRTMLAVALGVTLFGFVHAEESTIEPARGWRFRVFAQDLPAVDNLVFAGDGQLYATVEQPNGQGQIVRLRSGTVEPVLGDIKSPGGMYAKGKSLYLVEWIADGRALEIDLDSGAVYNLAVLRNPDGITVGREGEVFVTEDLVNGRVLRIGRTGQTEVVVGGLNRPGGVCHGKKGMLYIAETGTGRVLSYMNGTMRTVVEDLDEPDEIQCAPDGSLWITEGTNPGTLLHLRDGQLETILGGLMFPQGVAVRTDGRVYLAERGRNRVLVVSENGGKAAADAAPAPAPRNGR